MTSVDDSTTVQQLATIGGLPVRTHDHVCVLYRGEDQRDALMADFLAEGVGAGDRCYCMITSDNHRGLAAAVSARTERVVEDRVSEDPGRIDFVEPGGSHVRGGEFVSDRMLQFWEDWGARPSTATAWCTRGSSRT